jgi:hypothetical protein
VRWVFVWGGALTARGEPFSLGIDGDVVLQDVAMPVAAARGRIGLRHDGKPREFANIFVKDLDRKR